MHAAEGQRETLVETWKSIGTIEQSLQQEGCISVEIQVPQDEERPVLVTALWDSPDAYQGWLDNPWRAEASHHLLPLLDRPLEGELYAVRAAGGRTVLSAEDAA